MTGARPLPPAPLDPRELTPGDRSRIIEMAWADDVPFEAIQFQFGLDESAVIRFMKQSLKAGSFRLWRRRVEGRGAKHQRRLAVR
ncbi:MAG: TIGR03643 family protein [Hydrogenophaga sp.]|uniref:TIGR03643 family protein n=1 Tax=Hydrogenophaga sp. TaxID=1904254 RepID=UPI002631D845|nr:TIGR03643 family protein [Hydrogenophaga sp.]MDM7941765.1 TIGR03643 family protein [Hydrogenophaga sp.]